MTDSFLKPYTLVMRTLSPVHIGTGVKLGKSDFFMQNGRVNVVDETRLMNWILLQPNAEQLALALTDDLRRPDSGIDKFLKERFRGDLSQVIAYSLPSPASPKDIAPFMKQVGNQPYIPGSSIKGVLRSGLLRGKMLGEEALRDNAISAIEYGSNAGRKPKTNSDQIQSAAFVQPGIEQSKWSNYDVNRVLLVRDSKDLPIEMLEVAAVKTLSIQYDHSLKAKPYSIFVETLRANQTISFDVSWQTNLFSAGARSLGLQKLKELMLFLPEYCRRVSQDLMNQEINFYKRHGRTDLATWFTNQINKLIKSEENVFILPMGWGSGYDAKTITDMLGEETFELVVDTYKNTSGLGKPGRQREADWLGVDDSPKSRKVIERPGGVTEPMGWVACRFVAVGEEDWLANQRSLMAESRPVVIISVPLDVNKPILDTTPAVKVTLIENFSANPVIGDCFSGEVFEVTKNAEILLSIPGIDDVDAYAVLKSGTYPALMKSFEVIKCQVTGFEEDASQKNCTRVLCKAL